MGVAIPSLSPRGLPRPRPLVPCGLARYPLPVGVPHTGEICTVDGSEILNNIFLKGMVMSGITYVRTSVRFVALFVEKRRMIGWYAKINE